MLDNQAQFERRRRRVRAKINGSSARPRLAVSISNRHVTAQIIDDTKAASLAHVTTVGQKLQGGLSERAAWVGEGIAKAAKQKKVNQVVFDRGGKIYSKRLQALAQAARQQGLEF
jgi:large subunit ribosomal protein L18